ncbi:MAG: peptidylprolyl isomerase [Gammaproteobacteria bacterium]|nr:peptidylprolyl isomerase [Gammaproteobacteria bacterium]
MEVVMVDTVVEKNKVVSLAYTLKDEKGELFEYSDLPIAYLHGSGSDLFDKIESSLEGRKVGDKIKVILPPKDGFGEHDPSLIFSDDLDNVPPELRKLGTELEAQNAKGEVLKFVVTDIDPKKGKLTVDANHPLAGQTVSFEVTIKSIRAATPEELKAGQPSSLYDAPTGGES